MNDAQLQHIQALQFQDRAAAETLLLEFVREIFPDLNAQKVELRPLAVSLNSFNGFLTLADGRRLFFKTHVEPSSIVGEYYNTDLLVEAGYPIIRPLYASTEYGKQLLIYDLIDSPSVFDVARAIEKGEPLPGADLDALAGAQHKADEKLLEIYRTTWESQSEEDNLKAPIHQLFYHRLCKRYVQFYADKDFHLPGGIVIPWEMLYKYRWVINEAEYESAIFWAIQSALDLLNPENSYPHLRWSVVGHGDAHNGNVFYTPGGLTYFDPAFGGRHSPILDIAKPLFHNVFATWMYYPQEVAEGLDIQWQRGSDFSIRVWHNYRPSACRMMFFQSKIDRLLKPLVRRSAESGALVPDMLTGLSGYYARMALKSALMCCALLTMNLADRERFPPEIGLLGLCHAVEMGMENIGPNWNLLNQTLDEVFPR